MRTTASRFMGIAGLFGFLGVSLGAFGAHGLKETLVQNGYLDVWEKATLYLLVHTVALFCLSLCWQDSNSGLVRWAGWSSILGMLFFSGSLYLLALTGISLLGAITPFGGVFFLAGWACLVCIGFQGKLSLGGKQG